MKGIFKILFDLLTKSSGRPLEDYLTEIFAYVLKCNDSILLDFLNHFKIISGEAEDLTVFTQFGLKALANHDVDSRPDIAIFGKDVAIIIENKLNAFEGANQLSRYAEHLEDFCKNRNKLVYITRDFDRKDSSEVFSACSFLSQKDFIQIRWYEIALFLNKHRDNAHVIELLTFMKQIRITMNNHFTPIDLLTLSNFSNVRKTMDEILFGEISARFEKVNGNITQPTTCVTQLKSYDRYVYYSKHKGKINVLLGFWMNSSNEKEYPEFGIQIDLNPSSNLNQIWRTNFTKIGESYSGWEAHSLDSPNAWCSVSKKNSLQQVISLDDHIKAIKEFFNECITDLENIIIEFSLKEYN